MLRTLSASLLLCGCATASRTARPLPPGEQALRVATWNVNFGLEGDATTLAELGAGVDLLLLEETTPSWERTARATLGRDFPFQHWLHGPAAGGIAVLSRRPMQVEELVNPSGWFPALRVVAQTPLGPVQALVVHLHPR
jgi:hypothetical protein